MKREDVERLLERSRDGKSALSFTQDAPLVASLCKFFLSTSEEPKETQREAGIRESGGIILDFSSLDDLLNGFESHLLHNPDDMIIRADDGRNFVWCSYNGLSDDNFSLFRVPTHIVTKVKTLHTALRSLFYPQSRPFRAQDILKIINEARLQNSEDQNA
jgi:hypothetical protein